MWPPRCVVPPFVLFCQSQSLVSGRHDGRLLLLFVVWQRAGGAAMLPALGAAAATGVPPRLLWSHLEGHSVTAAGCGSCSWRLLLAAAAAVASPDERFQLLSHSQELPQVVPQTGQFRKLPTEDVSHYNVLLLTWCDMKEDIIAKKPHYIAVSRILGWSAIGTMKWGTCCHLHDNLRRLNNQIYTQPITT